MIVTLMSVSVFAEGKINPWDTLKVLEGKWVADKPGVSKNTQQYSFILKNKYLQMKTRSVFEPTEKKPKGEIHEDMAIFSYDKTRKLFVMRGFYVEGFVNTYTLTKSEDGKTLTFLSEDIENGMPGMKAKLVFKLISETEYEQSFYVAFPNKDYSCFFESKFIKQK